MSSPVVITGMGIISAAGNGVEETFDTLKGMKSPITTPRHIKTVHTRIPVGEVPLSNVEMAEILGVDFPADQLRTVLLGVIAAKEAVKDASLTKDMLKDAAFVNGTTVGGMDYTEKLFAENINTEFGVNQSALCYNDCGGTTDLIADYIGPFKTVTTTSTACSSAANAIITGIRLIEAGIVERAVVGGAEALSRFHLNGFNSLMILDSEICRPFDKERKGINLGEGAAFIVIEKEETALKRGCSKIYGVISGYANTCDAYHQTATSENGEGAFLSMKGALQKAGLNFTDIDYINSHGTGTPNNDMTEYTAMRRIWGEELPPYSSTKPFTGHTTSAAAAIETVICLLCLNRNFLPPNLGFKEPMEGCKPPVTNTVPSQRLNHILNNAFGFGGNDTSIIISRYE